MSEKEKEQSDKKIEERKEEQRKDYKKDVDFSEKIQAPQPWPDPPDDRDVKKRKDD